ncbi:transducin/WD40 repeat-like superfamily protein [Artemisia annua]|uniref:Transducin/WD40 repeat-like superfamily protein n=1 Tax=Artemisia annua TaxID=35608 RepID=A0A2U1LUH6_ARTAN|nr:transducin/WD40 repeat-like superfamily protein [Artemisia annua]
METTDMDIEPNNHHQQQQPITATSSSKKFALKNTIQTNFGDDYIFQIVHKEDWTTMAVSLSSNTVKLYSPVTGQYVGECCKGEHSDSINEILLNGNVLYSCSSDGTLRAWDTRSYQQVACLNAGPSQEIFSFSFGGTGDNLLAAGCKSQILFWDWRSKNQVACLEESHMDDVTQVRFVPGQQNKLVSASIDGLICTFDTSGEINDEDHMESVMNVGTSIGKLGFFGGTYDKLWCLTHIETLSIWDLNDSRLEANFEDARTLASNSWALDQVDYFVDCHYSAANDHLWVIGATNGGGSLGYFPVAYKGGMRSILSPEAVLHGGHTGVVRSVLPSATIKSGISQTQGIFGWTGGEDGRLCCWLSDASSDINHSWISTSLVEKNTKKSKKNRHRPY